MLETSSERAVIHAAHLSAFNLTGIPERNTRDARLIARAELANLWNPDDCWTEGILLELAEYVEDHAAAITGPNRHAIFDVQALANVMDNRQAAVMAIRLAGGYWSRVDRQSVLANCDGEEAGELVTFPTDFIRHFWKYQTDDMGWVLSLQKPFPS